MPRSIPGAKTIESKGMIHAPDREDVRSFIHDFEEDFGVVLPYGDARRILVLYEELCDLFEEHGGDGVGFEMRHLNRLPFFEA